MLELNVVVYLLADTSIFMFMKIEAKSTQNILFKDMCTVHKQSSGFVNSFFLPFSRRLKLFRGFYLPSFGFGLACKASPLQVLFRLLHLNEWTGNDFIYVKYVSGWACTSEYFQPNWKDTELCTIHATLNIDWKFDRSMVFVLAGELLLLLFLGYQPTNMAVVLKSTIRSFMSS